MLKRPRSRLIFVAATGTVSAALWTLVLGLSQGLPGDWSGPWSRLGNGFHYELPNELMPTGWVLLVQTILWFTMFVTYAGLRASGASLGRGAFGLILGFAVLFRLLMLPSVPIHENDYYRYLWDGKTFAHGVNPYRYEPAALFLFERGIEEPVRIGGTRYEGRPWSFDDAYYLERLAALRDENRQAFERIGHPQVPTIYPPAAQALFAGSHLLFGDSLAGLRLLFLGCDLGILLLVGFLLHRLDLPRSGVVLYAWCPLVILEFINSAHYDAFPVLLLLLAICGRLQSRTIASALAASTSALGKFFGGLILPLLVPPQPRNWRPYLAAAGWFTLSYLPFLVWQDTGTSAVFRGLAVFSAHWQNQGGLFLLIDRLSESVIPAARETYLPAKIIAGLLYLTALGWLIAAPTRDDRHRVRKCFHAMALLFVLNPTAFPWYYTWVIPFLALFPAPSWLILMGTVPLYYLGFQPDSPLVRAEWLGLPARNWLTWAPFALVWLGERWRERSFQVQD